MPNFNTVNTKKKIEKIVMAKPDKVSGIVLLNKTEHLGKMNELLNDTTKIVKLGHAYEFDILMKKTSNLIF